METTARHALPVIVPGQAQKEMTHNEALTLVDLALHAVVEGVRDVPPDRPATGACWIVGAAASGPWAGQAGAVAGWTAGGWRFLTLPQGASVAIAGGGRAWASDRGWTIAVPAAIPAPVGGDVVDGGARAAIAEVLSVLRAHGMIADPGA